MNWAKCWLNLHLYRESEAWEDFGTSRYTGNGGSHASSVESVDGKSRLGTAQSIWDIEVGLVLSLLHPLTSWFNHLLFIKATLRAGRPVSQAPPPPVPILTADLNNAYAPKRSKSLAARFRAGRKNPNNPLSDDIDEGIATPSGDLYDGRSAGKSDFGPSNGGSLGKNQFSSNYELGKNGGGAGRRTAAADGADSSRVYSPLSSSVPASGAPSSSLRFDTSKPIRASSYEKSTDTNEDDGGIRFVDNGFGGGTSLSVSKSLGNEDGNRLAGASQLVRKKSVLARLFGSKS